jgi:hypothetical protein
MRLEDEMKKLSPEVYLKRVKRFVSKQLDWNLKDAEVVAYTVTSNYRLQVTIFEHSNFGANATRAFLENIVDRANTHRIDLMIVHQNP